MSQAATKKNRLAFQLNQEVMALDMAGYWWKATIKQAKGIGKNRTFCITWVDFPEQGVIEDYKKDQLISIPEVHTYIHISSVVASLLDCSCQLPIFKKSPKANLETLQKGVLSVPPKN